MIIMDTAAKAGGVAVGDGQARDGDDFTRSDVKYGTLLVAIYRKVLSTGPEIVMLLSTSSSPAVNPIVPVTAKLIMSPLFASASAWRNEPGPLSSVLVTVMTIGVGDGVPDGVGLAAEVEACVIGI